MRRALVVLILVVTTARAPAQVSVGVTLTPEGDALATQLGLSSADLAMKIQERVDDAYDTANVDGFLRSFTDATAFSMRGLGVDYVSAPRNIMFGIGANLAAAAGGGIGDDQRPTAGLAANVGLMAGVNLGRWNYPRWTVFGNGFYRNGSTQHLKGGISTFGGHAQVRLVQPQRDAGAATKLLRWTGIDLTGGIEVTHWSLGVNKSIDTDLTVDGTSGSAPLTLSSTGTFDLTSTAATIPIEISTGFRIALLVSFYVGAGFDFTAGKSKVDANLTGQLHTTDNRDVGTVTIAGSGDNTGSPAAARVLAGVQLNLWKLKIYVQANASATPAASVGFGLRLVL